MKTAFVTDLLSEQIITSFFLVHEKEVRNTREGRSYLRLELGDRSGTIEARMWEQFEVAAKDINRDDFVKVQARVEVYKNRPQLSIVQVRLARPEEIDLVDYLPHTKADVEAMWEQLLGHAQSIGNPWLRQLVQSIIADPEVARCYKRAPAAKTMHHAYIGGLLEHVVSLCGMAKVIAGHYAELDGDLLLTAAILHDVGKLEELCYERAIGYTTEGQLLGHIVMELETVLRAIDKIEGFPVALKTVVQHLLISHHGQYEFGSPKLPMIREAMVFHYLDDLDSKLAASRVALATPSGDDEWSAYSSALGRRFLKLDEFLKAKDPAASPQPPQPATLQPSAAPAAQTAISAAAQSAASQPAAAHANSAAAKPSGYAASSQQPFSRPPLENSHSKPAPKPKSEQSFLRKLFS
jgi:3'-5' exoribonuclease